MLILRNFTAVVAWVTLALQYWILITAEAGSGPYDPNPIARTINFFSYFSIISTVLVAAAMTLPTLMPSTAAGRLLAKPSARTGIAVYIIIVATVYFLLLRHTWHPQGLQIYTDAALHYAVPALYVLDWVVLVPKGTLQPRDALVWLLLPLAYALWTLAHGTLSRFYPYPFVDVTTLGYARTLLNMTGFVFAFLVLGLLLVVVDRRMPSRLR